MSNSFKTLNAFDLHGRTIHFHDLTRLEKKYRVSRLPFAHRILLENLLRHEDGVNITPDDIEALCNWDPKAEPSQEIAFTPARVVLQDFTGVPAVVDLAAMRDAVEQLGGNPDAINPLSPAELVIDHSIQVDRFGTDDALSENVRIEFERNQERYQFLKWGQQAFENFKVVPPSNGIVHQVNLERLARVVFQSETSDGLFAYPDTVVGTDSHTTMINGIGVLGWGVGGIEAEAAMLGQPISMLIPQVVGFRLTGQLQEGVTATDLVLRIVEMLREKGVVGKFVEFFGPALRHLPLADRATIANMAPEYGATCGIFPIDEESIHYLSLTGRDEQQVELVRHYARAQGLFHDEDTPEAEYSDLLELDLGEVVPSIAGPKRPQDRIALSEADQAFCRDVKAVAPEHDGLKKARVNDDYDLQDGSVVIAAITSCTNTSNPAVMVGAGILARKAREKGLQVKPWVKTSLAPGSRVVTEYLEAAGLLEDLDALGFYPVGFGCTTCIGNSGPLPAEISQAIRENDLVACSVLSGNRNFEGRVHPDVRMNYLASPPLVVAYALAGRMDINLQNEPLGTGSDGKAVYLKDIWPSMKEIQQIIGEHLSTSMFRKAYEDVFKGEERWQRIASPEGSRFAWDTSSTYIQNPPYFNNMSMEVEAKGDIIGARCLALLGDSITTDHISPAGVIKADTPAGQYLMERGVPPEQFNSYGSRRGNHEVMMRGTFANIRLRNRMAPGTEGGWTRYQPTDEQMFIYDAAMRYQAEGVPLVVIAGKEYGTGSSRDWAAKGTSLLGVKAVITESFERIHRSNLVGMGVLPLNFMEGENADSLGLTGRERFDITGLNNGESKVVTVTAHREEGEPIVFQARVRLDTPKEVEYYRHGGILHYVLRQLARG